MRETRAILIFCIILASRLPPALVLLRTGCNRTRTLVYCSAFVVSRCLPELLAAQDTRNSSAILRADVPSGALRASCSIDGLFAYSLDPFLIGICHAIFLFLQRNMHHGTRIRMTTDWHRRENINGFCRRARENQLETRKEERLRSPNDCIFHESRSKTRSSGGIVQQDVEASSKLIVDSRTMANR